MRVRYKNLFAFTGDAALPLLESFVVEAGRIVPDDAPVDREVDLAGGFVTPLFSDQHTHPSYVAQTLSALAALPPDVLSIEDLVGGLVRKAKDLPEGAWIEAWGYDESLLKENRSPTRLDLDRVATDRPVFVRRSDCHSAVVNTYLLKAAGIDRTTPDPEGGRFGRDASGEPDGRLIETAAVRRVERLRKKEDFEGNVRRMCALGEHYLSRGIGFVTEMMCERGEKDLLPVYRAARKAGLPLAVGMYLVWQGGGDPFGMPDFTEDEKTGPVRYAGLKVFADGSISGKTAAIRGRYPGLSDDENPRGTMCVTEPIFRAGLAWAKRNGVQLSVHVMGDRSIDRILDWLEGEKSWLEKEPSVRLEHVSYLRPDHLERIAGMPLSIAMTTQPIFPFAEWKGYEEAIPRSMIDEGYAVKTIAARIPAFALSSDSPATTWADPDQPFVTVAAAVTRRDARGTPFGQAEAVDVATALSLYTSRAARVTDLGTKGLLLAGESADFVLWSENPFAVAKEELADIRARRVWRAGELLWEAEA